MEGSTPDYHSGDDFTVEFLDYRYRFARTDFAQRVSAAAVRLELVDDRDLEPGEMDDLVALAADGHDRPGRGRRSAHTCRRTPPSSTRSTRSRSRTGCASSCSAERGSITG